MTHIIEELAGDWRRLDDRIEGLSAEITAMSEQDAACQRLMTVPGIGPIISSATVAAIGNGGAFSKGATLATGSAWSPGRGQSLPAWSCSYRRPGSC
jgi:transposase